MRYREKIKERMYGKKRDSTVTDRLYSPLGYVRLFQTILSVALNVKRHLYWLLIIFMILFSPMSVFGFQKRQDLIGWTGGNLFLNLC